MRAFGAFLAAFEVPVLTFDVDALPFDVTARTAEPAFAFAGTRLALVARRAAPVTTTVVRGVFECTAARVRPMSAGDSATAIPAARSASFFSAAVPLPPAMIAPAWPMRLPGGAVAPAMNAATGLRTSDWMKAAASSSALPPISPIRRMASVSGSRLKSASASRKVVPITGSPPMPTHVLWPRPRLDSCQTASYVSVPERETTPTRPGRWM